MLVRFEIPMLAAEVQRQPAEVVRAQAALDNAKAAQTRARDLFERGVAARREVEEANRAVAEAEAAAHGGARVARRRADRCRTRDRAGDLRRDRRQALRTIPAIWSKPTASDPVLRVIDPRRLEVVASVPSATRRGL